MRRALGSRATRRFTERRSAPSAAQRSRKTAPASTEGSWSASPSRTRRASSRSARSSRSIVARSIIDASSTMTTRCGQRVVLVPREAPVDGDQPSRRCSVCGLGRDRGRVASAMSRAARTSPAAMASCSRCAALPVGAATAMASMGMPVQASARRSATTMVVFPVPGPPVTSASGASAQCARRASARRSARGGPSATAFSALPARLRVARRAAARAAIAHARAEPLLEHAHPLGVEPLAVDDERRAVARPPEHGLAADVGPARARASERARVGEPVARAPTAASAGRSRSSSGTRVLPARIAATHAAASACERPALAASELRARTARSPSRGRTPRAPRGRPLARPPARRPSAAVADRAPRGSAPSRCPRARARSRAPPRNRRAPSVVSHATTSSQLGRADQRPSPRAPPTRAGSSRAARRSAPRSPRATGRRGA